MPIVGRLPADAPAAPGEPEVERVLWLPLAELVRPDTYRSERWGRTPTDRLLHFFELDDETVWGATAHMLVDLLARRPPTPTRLRRGGGGASQAARDVAPLGGRGADREAQGDRRRRARCG